MTHGSLDALYVSHLVVSFPGRRIEFLRNTHPGVFGLDENLTTAIRGSGRQILAASEC